jgi:hypothetical protein
VRENLTAIPQTADTVEVRQRTYELVEFVHDVLQVPRVPVGGFPHAVGLHNGCASLRALRTAKMSEIDEPFFSKPLDLLSKVKGIRFVTPERPTNAAVSRHVFRVEETGLRENGLRQGERPQERRVPEYIVSGDMSCIMHQKGCAERLEPSDQVHPYRDRFSMVLGSESASTTRKGPRSSSRPRIHLDFHDKRLWDLRKKRDRESEHLPEWEELRVTGVSDQGATR